MSTTNRIAAGIPQDLIDFTNRSLSEILTRWSLYKQTLDAGDRESMAKMGLNRMPMAFSVRKFMATNPEIVPAFINPADMKIDLDNAGRVEPLRNQGEQLVSILADIELVSKAEAYEDCLAIYANAKVIAERQADVQVQEIVDDLAQYYRRRPAKKAQQA